MNNIMSGDPFSMPASPIADAPAPDQQSLGSVMGPTSPGGQYQGSQLSDHLQNIGIDHGNLAMNDLGRVQLIGRLKKQYGPDFINNSDAKQALSMFDSEVGKFSMDANNDLTRMNSSGKQTLSALLG